MNKKPFSYYTNRIGLAIVLIFFGYQLYYGIRNNEPMNEWVILSTIGAIATLVASPNKSFETWNKQENKDVEEGQ